MIRSPTTAPGEQVLYAALELSKNSWSQPLTLILRCHHDGLDDAQRSVGVSFVQILEDVRQPVLQDIPESAFGEQPAPNEAGDLVFLLDRDKHTTLGVTLDLGGALEETVPSTRSARALTFACHTGVVRLDPHFLPSNYRCTNAGPKANA